MGTNNKIYYNDAGQVKEAKGEKLEEILQYQAQAAEAQRLFEAAEKEKAEKKESATNKLKALGLTDSEVEALLG